jgi:DDE superfamily endonuclease
MEDVLAVYTRPRDPTCPLVCLDETSKQLIAETRVPIPMKPGRSARFDYEYERNGTSNLFMLFAPLEGWRHVKVTDRHTAVDYAHVLRDLADVHFADAGKIVLVQDNLNIHCRASLYEAFAAPEARRLVERFGRVGRGLSPSASRRTVRETLTSHRSHQANMPVTPSSQCTNSLRLLTAMDSINRPARIFAPLWRLYFRMTHATNVALT